MFLTIVLPAYNAERFLAEAIDSVLNQTYRCFELILIDDGSSDRSLDIMKEYEARDERIVVVAQENLGVSTTMNQAISLAKSDWIVRMDADDVMEPTRLERALAFLAEHPDVAVTSSLVTYIDASGRVLGKSAPEFTTDEEVRKAREEGRLIGFHQPGALMRKDVVMGIGGYRSEFVSAQDMDLWNRIVDAGGRILVQPEYLLRYRIHATQTTVRLARDTYLRTELIKQNGILRRRGLPELSYVDFLQNRRRKSFYRRINDERKLLAKIQYKRATFAHSTGKPFQAAWLSIVSSLLDPTYAPGRIWRRLRGRTSTSTERCVSGGIDG